MSLIYLAYPIDLAEPRDTADINAAVRHIKRCLQNSAHVAYDPGSNGAFTVGALATVNRSIKRINDTALDAAAAMVVFYPNGARSWGVPAEVERMLNNGGYVAMVTNRDNPTWAMPQKDDPQIRYFAYDGRTRPIEGAAAQAAQWMMDIAHGDGTMKDSRRLPVTLTPKIEYDGMGAPTEWDAIMPTRAHEDDAGLDLYVQGNHTIEPGQFMDIPSGVAVELPGDSWAYLTGRSSTLRKHRLLVNPGVIDAGYRGELYSGVQNMGDVPVTINHGDRIAQLILLKNGTRDARPVEVSSLRGHARGTSGFGSSGA